MVTNRRRYTRGRREGLAELGPDLRIALEYGDITGTYHPDTLAESWEVYREEVLDAWEASNPGTRPWAWWEFDAPEPRRVINPPSAGSYLETDNRKRPGRVLVGDGGNPPDLVPWLEEEADYLTRLGLDE